MRSTLEEVGKAAQDKRNVMPYLVEATKAYSTIGEITNVLKETYGTFREPVAI